MAVNGAQITLVGNCTRDPEMKYSNSGMAVARFGLAVNYRKMNRNSNEWDEEVSFFDIVAFGQLGENVGDTISKGTRAIVVGRLQIRDWEGQDGKKGRSVEVIADEIGPSLRWATADIHRAERSDDGGSRGGGGGGGGRGGNRGGNGGGGNYDDASYDEEPF